MEKKIEIKSINHWQQLLNNSNLSQSTNAYLQAIINSIKRQGNMATEKQYNLLKQLRDGYNQYSTKNEIKITPSYHSLEKLRNLKVGDYVIFDKGWGKEEFKGKIKELRLDRTDDIIQITFRKKNGEEYGVIIPKDEILYNKWKNDSNKDNKINIIEFESIRKIKDLDEIKITPHTLNIPEGWEQVEVDEDDLEYGILYQFEAPMEGWDDEHYDIVRIQKYKEKYTVTSIFAFGDSIDEDITYNNKSQALAKAIEIMNNIKEDWDGDEEIDEIKRMQELAGLRNKIV